ncbi:protein adenylyltransferase SelO family protein, partial [bacterium]|nr:protein adenylyltransferase SelO family protein [bacterium]
KDAIGFLDAVISKQATLISKWMGVGFIHGVMNTDNTHIGGITIDYGPCAFMDDYIPSKVFSSIDVNGRYSYEEQPKVIVWNLVRLAISLLPLIDSAESEAIKKAELSLSKFDKLYQDNFRTLFLKKIGISHEINGDLGLLTDLLNSMTNSKADFTQTFIELSALNHNSQIDHPQKFLNEWKIKWANRLEQEKDPVKVMSQTNPMFIPRNHLIEHAIQNATLGDYKLFNDLLLASKNPFKKSLENEALYISPDPNNLVSQTFCGT